MPNLNLNLTHKLVWEAKARHDDEAYILRLIKQILAFRLETVNIVNSLLSLKILEEDGLSLKGFCKNTPSLSVMIRFTAFWACI